MSNAPKGYTCQYCDTFNAITPAMANFHAPVLHKCVSCRHESALVRGVVVKKRPIRVLAGGDA